MNYIKFKKDDKRNFSYLTNFFVISLINVQN